MHVVSRATIAQSHQRRFRRWLSNRRIDVAAVHHPLVAHSRSQWGNERMYLSLDTTVVWNCLCIVWVGVVYRGRTIPIAWRVVAQASSTVRLWTIQRVLRQALRVIPEGVVVVLLADRGFADGKLMKYLRENLESAFSHPHQTLVPISTGGHLAQGVISATAKRTCLFHSNGVPW